MPITSGLPLVNQHCDLALPATYPIRRNFESRSARKIAAPAFSAWCRLPQVISWHSAYGNERLKQRCSRGKHYCFTVWRREYYETLVNESYAFNSVCCPAGLCGG